jgi:alginate O-acetyltransferase complex protein AlgI
MVFNSPEFIFLFLPATVAIFYLSGVHRNNVASAAFLIFASLVFYGLWDVRNVPVLLFSIVFNFALGSSLIAGKMERRHKLGLLIVGLSIDLGMLLYFKYFNFMLSNMAQLWGFRFAAAAIIMPLGISFFTFQKIAFLIDTYQGHVRRYDLVYFTWFATFSPN